MALSFSSANRVFHSYILLPKKTSHGTVLNVSRGVLLPRDLWPFQSRPDLGAPDEAKYTHVTDYIPHLLWRSQPEIVIVFTNKHCP